MVGRRATNGNKGPSTGPWLEPFARHGFHCSKVSTAPRFRRVGKTAGRGKPPVGENHCTRRQGSLSVIVVYHIPETIDQPYCDQN